MAPRLLIRTRAPATLLPMQLSVIGRVLERLPGHPLQKGLVTEVARRLMKFLVQDQRTTLTLQVFRRRLTKKSRLVSSHKYNQERVPKVRVVKNPLLLVCAL